MSGEDPDLDQLQATYKAAVEAWVASIRKEEALASVNHSVAEIDQWEQAHLDEDDMRTTVKAARWQARSFRSSESQSRSRRSNDSSC